VLDSDFVAADDHVVVLAVVHAFAAFRQHTKSSSGSRRANVADRVIGRALLVGGRRHPGQPAVRRTVQLCRTVHRVGDPAGGMSITSMATELVGQYRTCSPTSRGICVKQQAG